MILNGLIALGNQPGITGNNYFHRGQSIQHGLVSEIWIF